MAGQLEADEQLAAADLIGAKLTSPRAVNDEISVAKLYACSCNALQ